MKHINSSTYRIEIGSLLESSLGDFLDEKYHDGKKVIIADDNTHENCLGFLIGNYECLNDAEIVVIPAGEDSKQMQIAFSVWEALTDYQIGRNDLIINLGGGVISDLGGFIASCYKRGCDYINIPTSLLGMVDASIGGKTGINLGVFKNQIGTFSNPEAIYIDPVFLDTLPEVEFTNGFAEILKHGLISDESLFNDALDILRNGGNVEVDFLYRSIIVKHKIVSQDPLEKGNRKLLNLGHTIGHVLEGELMHSQALPHGHAVAIGIVMEAYLSKKMKRLSGEEYLKIEEALLEHYSLPKINDSEIKAMIELLSNDKKNRNGKVLSCLINSIGNCSYDNEITQELFLETFLHFKNKQINFN